MDNKIPTHEHTGTDSPKVKFENLEIFAEAAISQPSGGATVDTESRNAINDILLLLRTKGLMK